MYIGQIIFSQLMDFMPRHGQIGRSKISLSSGGDIITGIDGETKLPVRAGFSETLRSLRQERWLIGFVKDNWKYTVTPEDSVEELFNLMRDPCEVNNLIVEERERAKRMREELIENGEDPIYARQGGTHRTRQRRKRGPSCPWIHTVIQISPPSSRQTDSHDRTLCTLSGIGPSNFVFPGHGNLHNYLFIKVTPTGSSYRIIIQIPLDTHHPL